SIPDLERLLDLLIPNQEADMPKSNDRHVDRTITRGGRSALYGRWWHLRLVSDGSRSGGHRSERSTALGHCGRAEGDQQHRQSRNPDESDVMDHSHNPAAPIITRHFLVHTIPPSRRNL